MMSKLSQQVCESRNWLMETGVTDPRDQEWPGAVRSETSGEARDHDWLRITDRHRLRFGTTWRAGMCC